MKDKHLLELVTGHKWRDVKLLPANHPSVSEWNTTAELLGMRHLKVSMKKQ